MFTLGQIRDIVNNRKCINCGKSNILESTSGPYVCLKCDLGPMSLKEYIKFKEKLDGFNDACEKYKKYLDLDFRDSEMSSILYDD